MLGEPPQLLVVERLEEEQLSQLVGGQHLCAVEDRRGGRHGDTRYRWASVTAIAPSPTAEATRLTESARASPATNTPGTLASSGHGSRSSGQPRGRWPSTTRSGPVTRNPRSSRSRVPSSHSVRGWAPMNTKAWPVSTRSLAPETTCRSVSASRWPSPCASATTVHSRRVTLSIACSCSIRYCDMLTSRLSARTRSVTDLATREKNTAAWPAELAPPTM